jgi:hypothetical protein
VKVGRLAYSSAAAVLAGALLSCVSCSSCRHATRHSATPVGSPVGGAVSANIGPGGGSLAAPDGSLRVTIPPGVLSAPARVSLQPVTNQAHGGIGSASRIEVEGSVQVPRATLVFTYAERDLTGSAPGALRAAFQRADGQWQVAARAVVDPKARTVTVQTDHFSDWSLVRGMVLKPSEATVKVGQSAYFEVVSCLAPETKEDDLAPLVVPCEPRGLPEDAEWEGATWQVNGRAGGDGTIGTVAEAGDSRGRYTAPGKVPDPDQVTVSARFKSSEHLPGGTDVLLASVRIEEDPSPGQIVFTVEATCDADYKFTDGTNSVSDRVSVTLSERSIYRIVRYADGENGTDLELVSYRSRVTPDGAGSIQGPVEIPPDLLAKSWSYRSSPPTHPSGGLRLDLPHGRARVGLWANFAELISATPENGWAGASTVAVATINDAERDGVAYQNALRASFEPGAKRVEVTGLANHAYTQPGGLGSGRLRVRYAISGGTR